MTQRLYCFTLVASHICVFLRLHSVDLSIIYNSAREETLASRVFETLGDAAVNDDDDGGGDGDGRRKRRGPPLAFVIVASSSFAGVGIKGSRISLKCRAF